MTLELWLIPQKLWNETTIQVGQIIYPEKINQETILFQANNSNAKKFTLHKRSDVEACNKID